MTFNLITFIICMGWSIMRMGHKLESATLFSIQWALLRAQTLPADSWGPQLLECGIRDTIWKCLLYQILTLWLVARDRHSLRFTVSVSNAIQKHLTYLCCHMPKSKVSYNSDVGTSTCLIRCWPDHQTSCNAGTCWGWVWFTSLLLVYFKLQC